MEQPEQFIACRCVECGVPGDVPIKAALLGWWPRRIGWVVGIGIVLAWIAALLLRGPTAVPIGSRGVSGFYYIDPVVAAADLPAIAAGDPATRDRIVAPLGEFRRRWRAEFPFSEEAVTFEVLPPNGTWSSAETFGKPVAWVQRIEGGMVTPGPAAGAGVSLLSLDAWRAGARFQMDQSYTTPAGPQPAIILGSLSFVAVASLAVGFLASRVARRRRRAIFLFAATGVVGASIAWSVAAGPERIRVFGNPTLPPPLPATSSVLLTPAELADPALTDAALAARILEGPNPLEEGYLGFASIPEYTWCNSTMQLYGKRSWVFINERVSFARTSDPAVPIPLPARGWDVRLTGDYLSVDLPAADSATAIRRVSCSVAPIAMVILGAIAAGAIIATAVRWPLLRRARRRRRDNLCIACAYPLPSSV